VDLGDKMPHNVNIFTSGWRPTGSNVSTPQYETTIRVDWTDNAGKAQTRTELVRFPNILAQVPASWVADEKDLLMRALRVKAGIDATPEQVAPKSVSVVRSRMSIVVRTFLSVLLAKMAQILDVIRDWLLTMRCKLKAGQ
jgi:hypothetical protein